MKAQLSCQAMCNRSEAERHKYWPEMQLMDLQSASSHCSAAILTYLEQKSLPLAPVASIPMYFVICRLPRSPHNSIYLHNSLKAEIDSKKQ